MLEALLKAYLAYGLPSCRYAVATHPGIVRMHKPNEDYAYASHGWCSFCERTVPYTVLIVSDGMGGHSNGQVAAQTTVTTVVDTLLPQLGSGRFSSFDEIASLLEEAIQRANKRIWNCRSSQTTMGATVTAVLRVDTQVSVANVGDSRTYLFRPENSLQAITRDHSVVADMVRAGKITSEEVYTHPERNKIYRALGCSEVVEVDMVMSDCCERDVLLLCSDGLWEMVRDHEITSILALPHATADEMVSELVSSALKHGGRDNISAVVLQVSHDITNVPTQVLSL